MNWYLQSGPVPCSGSRAKAKLRQQSLTKPPGSLGRLEAIAEDFAAWQKREKPHLDRIAIRVFAGDHGVCAQGVSAFPAEVTAQMVANFLTGGAAISVLSQRQNTDFAVVNMGLLHKIPDAPNLVNLHLASGTHDFTQRSAMSQQCLQDCLNAGRDQVDLLDCDLFIAGEMGIGNTSSASALMAATLRLSAEDVVGRGSGIDDKTLKCKQAAIQKALTLHASRFGQPLSTLQMVGGLEIAAMVGAYIRCAQRGIPVLLDGFIACAAALIAVRLNPSTAQWMMAAHQSAESAHKTLLDALDMRPIVNLDMRLGEGSGAAVALPLIQAALALHTQMFTFAEAGISSSEG